MMMTACLLVNSHRNGIDRKEGKAAASTCGIVSPIIIQKAIMPPKALNGQNQQEAQVWWFLISRTKPIERPNQDYQQHFSR